MQIASPVALGGPLAFLHGLFCDPFREQDWFSEHGAESRELSRDFAHRYTHAGAMPAARDAWHKSLVDFYRTRRVGAMSQEFAKLPPEPALTRWYERAFLQNGVRDLALVNATDPSGAGWLIAAPSLTYVEISEQATEALQRVAAHFAAALRLRSLLHGSARAPSAVLSPSGKLEHAEDEAKSPEAREALRFAVVAMGHARSKELRTGAPEQAAEAWPPLCDGRWSLLDQFERDGRRYIVAHRNTPAVTTHETLSERERLVAEYVAMGHSNKLVAYELGLSLSSVATYLRRALEKLSMSSRLELTERGVLEGS